MKIKVKVVKVGSKFSIGNTKMFYTDFMYDTKKEAIKQALIENLLYYQNKMDNIKTELIDDFNMDYREIGDCLA